MLKGYVLIVHAPFHKNMTGKGVEFFRDEYALKNLLFFVFYNIIKRRSCGKGGMYIQPPFLCAQYTIVIGCKEVLYGQIQ